METFWPRRIGKTHSVVHADGKAECSFCCLEITNRRKAYSHESKCTSSSRMPMETAADKEENSYLLQLLQLRGLKVADERCQKLYGIYLDGLESGLLADRVLVLSRAKQLLEARPAVGVGIEAVPYAHQDDGPRTVIDQDDAMDTEDDTHLQAGVSAFALTEVATTGVEEQEPEVEARSEPGSEDQVRESEDPVEEQQEGDGLADGTASEEYVEEMAEDTYDLIREDLAEWVESDSEDPWYLPEDPGRDDMPLGKGCVCGRCDGPYVHPGTAEYLKAHLDSPVARGVDAAGTLVDSGVTTRELCIAILKLHLHYNIGKECMDVLLALFSSVLPGVHFIPRSIHLLRKVTDTPNHTDFIKHACSSKGCPGHLYPDLPERDWLDHAGDKCPECSHPRFTLTEVGGKWKAVPNFPFHYLGAEKAILEQLLAVPKFREQRAQHRDTGEGSNGASMFNGTEVRRIRERNKKVMRKDRSLVEVTLDFLQPFSKSPYSVGVGGIKVSDVEPRNRCKSFTTAITTVIPGPNQPNTMYPYLLPLVSDLEHLSSSGMSVPLYMMGDSIRAAIEARRGAMDDGRVAGGGPGIATHVGAAAGGAGGAGGRVSTGGGATAGGGAAAGVARGADWRGAAGGREAAAHAAGGTGPMGGGIAAAGGRAVAGGAGAGRGAAGDDTAASDREAAWRAAGGAKSGGGGVAADEEGTLYFHCWGFMGDSPARWKCGNMAGISKNRACSFCKMCAVYLRDNASRGGALRVLGYDKPQHQERFPQTPMKVGDPWLRLTDAEHRQRGQCVAAAFSEARLKTDPSEKKRLLKVAEDLSSELGCKGVNVFSLLPHVDLQNFFLVPAAHALLYGVVKRFIKSILEKAKAGASELHHLTLKAKSIMRSRASHISVTADFGRRYRCIVQYVDSYLMEDWLHFVDTFAPYILKDVLPPLLREMWGFLTVAIRHYFRPRHFENRTAFIVAAAGARDALLKYATLSERHDFPMCTFTMNLHMCICRLYDQEVARGAVANDLEFVVERMMQQFKRITGRRITSRVEAHFMQQFLLGQSLERVIREHPEAKDLPAILGRAGRQYEGVLYDEVDDGVLLLGRGVPTCTRTETLRQDIIDAISVAVQHEEGDGLRQWAFRGPGQQITADTAAIQKALEERRASRPRALLYYRAEVEEETLFSEQYGRVRSRVSHYILVVYNIAGVDTPYIARIRCFVKLPSGQVTTDGASTISATRMAICSLTRARKEGDLYVTDRSCEVWESYALPPSALKGRIEKLVVAIPPSDRDEKKFYMTFYHMTDR